MNDMNENRPLMTRIVETFLRGDVAIMLVVVSLIVGAASLWLTPREEEPQIVVPLADVFVSAPGLSAEEVESKIANRLEKLVYQIDGVEYVYSMSRPGECIVTVRFFVGEDREDSLVKLYNKIHSNLDQVPDGVKGWVVKPIEIDDVPIVNVTLWSESPRYGDHALRRLAEQIEHDLQAVSDTNRVSVIGGRPRAIRVELDPIRLAARQTSALQVVEAIRASNVRLRSGRFEQQDREIVVEAGTFIEDARDIEDLVIQVSDDRPVYLKEVATVLDGPSEVDGYSWIGFGPAALNPRHPTDRPSRPAEVEANDESTAIEPGSLFPAVHLAVAKRKGSNAVSVARAVERRMEELATTHLPDGVYYRITRDYGETANLKVNELVESLAIAVLTVIGLIGVMIGWRAALVVALAIPVCYSITLFINLLAGYTINRVTLFALILSLGLLVDDPITDVENIVRYFALRILPPRESVVRAIQEVQPALILSTLAIIASFLPLMFITGMMGPYMAPMALCVPLTVTISTLVALMITPWVAMVALRKMYADKSDGTEPGFDLTARPLYRICRALLDPLLRHRWASWTMLAGVAGLLLAAMGIVALRVVPLKMLPYDNKNEFQIVVDMPEGVTLEETNALTERMAHYLAGVAEVRDFQLYVGLASPMDFNGMVRHYFLRRGSNVADIRVNLAPKHRRSQQSHAMVLRLRDDLTALAAESGARIKMVEVPPGPPVIATITAEIYGPPDVRYEDLIDVSRVVARRMDREPYVVDVDISGEDDQELLVFEPDKAKAALSGVSTEDIALTLRLALSGMQASVAHPPREVDPLGIEVRIPRRKRSARDDLKEIYVRGREGQMVQLGALGRFVETTEEKTIYHKNLRRVAYAYGDVAGRPP
ncbi:MAG TPA: AcrB/AcrD/AcrF family protein, partial [Planctomycetaceae bacterium]|nr:AcrB/AcrD/AcrF family protein [Planctomycetaceae bacterium]